MVARLLFILRWRLIAVLAIVLLPCPGAAIADVLILRNGSRIEGKVKVCDEEHCAVGAKQVALDQIARIELRSGVAVPAAAGAGSIVLIDGTLRVARFTGLSLGVVDIDGAEIDRDQVAVIILAGPSPPTGRPAAVPGDVLILADGSRRVGRLTTCTAASCRLDSHLVPLDTVRWIGLLGEGGQPPQAEDTADIIFRKGQSVGARLGGIDATTVRSTRGNFVREDVLWIHLAPALKGGPPSGVIMSPDPEPQPQGGSAIDKGKDKTSPPPQPGQSGSSSDKGKDKTSGPKSQPPPTGRETPGTPGDLWTGTIDGERTLTSTGRKTTVHHYTAHFDVRLRERNKKPIDASSSKPPYRRIVGWTAELWNEGTRVDATWDGGICSDQASTTYSDKDLPAGHYWWKLPDPTPLSVDNQDIPTDGIYGLRMGTCCWDPCGVPSWRAAHYALQYDPVLIGFGGGVNSEYENSLRPPRYHHMNADHTRMTGSFDVVKPYNPPSAGNDHLKVSWNLCKEGSGACSPEKKPSSPDDGCPDALEADSRLETNRIQKEQKFEERKKHSIAADKHKKEAQAHYDDFRKTVKACFIQSVASTLLIGLLAPEAEGAAAGEDVVKAWEFMEKNGFLPPTQFQLIAKIAEKLSKGEDPTTALLPEEVQTLIETAAAMELVKSSFKGANVEQMEKSMEDCAGALLVSAETKLSADKGVEAFKQELEEETEAQKLTNDISRLDDAYPDLQFKSFEACVQRARCKGTPESACADKKPPGDWPDVK